MCQRIHGGGIIFRSSILSSVRAWRDISVLRGSISMRLATNIHHVNGCCWKGVQGQMSKLKGQSEYCNGISTV